jgi:prepilin-type processing-associated H-X9-DG protein
MARHTLRRGFTLLELVVIMGLVLVLAAFALAEVDEQKETANRVKCASNLRQIGQAFLLYANENRGAYPRTRFDPETAGKPAAFTNPQMAEPDEDERKVEIEPPYLKTGPKVNDVTAALFRLIATQEISPQVFVCPSVAATMKDEDLPEVVDVKKLVNFSDPRQLSYSYANPYPNEAAIADGYKLNSAISAEFAIAADINPGVEDLLTANVTVGEEQMKKVNSSNHQQDGQNVLFGDGHVEFQNTPFCGIERDNIYTHGKTDQTSGGEGIIGSPSSAKDSILLPTANHKIAKQ